MGQYKIYITYGWRCLLGFSYDKGSSFEISFLCFTFGIGLTDSAKGFGFWRN